MASVRGVKAGWLRMVATVAVASSVAGLAAWGADGAKPSPKKATGKAEVKAPEVVRTDDHEDVDGRTRKADAPSRAASPPSLRPSDLDALIAKGLQASKTEPSPITSDEEFIRRLYLDVLGRLPNPGSIREFAAARQRDKRALLIDNLLNQPEYAENWARYWRDVIAYRSPNENDNQVNYPLFEKWLAEQFAANKPWNKIVTEIITATGSNQENGATIFTVAEEGQAVEIAGEASRVFMGVQIQCAQCHDHPSDPWKRQQFHEFAAFFVGVKSKRVQGSKPPAFTVDTSGPSHYTMPDLKHPEKKIPVSPRFFLNDAPKVSEQVKADQRLVLVANYITDPENPWFTRAFINRVWYSLMGEGFYTPIDDLGPARTPNAPEILDAVAESWQRSGYDIRWLFRTILTTEAYQRKSRSTDSAAGRTPFASNCPSRLRADQIFDALAHALDLGHERDQVLPRLVKGKAAPAPKEPKGIPGRDQFNKTFGVDPSTPNDDVLGTIPQALYLMNGPVISREVQAKPGTMLGQLLMAYPENRAVLDVLYLRALGRKPSANEVSTCSKYLQHVGDRREAFEDILWALINTTEFLSRR
jgi:Protein of unknown function (DUF1549)/Protein of unknown function (DUF1553)